MSAVPEPGDAPTPAPTSRVLPGAREGLEPVAVLEAVHKQFDGKTVLKGVDLRVPAGGITVLMGGSGSGKTTAMRILLGLESYDAGSVRLLGQEMGRLPAREKESLMMRVGALFQFGALFDSMTVAENVGFALRYVRGLSDEEIAPRVCENLDRVGLHDVETLYPAQLSGGMRKRVALARAIAHEPEVLLVDEPTTGLDPVMKGTIVDLIQKMRDELGVAVLCISHDMRAAFRMADHMGLIHQGRVLVEGTPDEVRECEHPAVKEFLAGL